MIDWLLLGDGRWLLLGLIIAASAVVTSILMKQLGQ